jgi:phosphoglycolate phosphatase
MARIVFDLDGTLVDSAPDLHGIANRVLADRGLEPITLDEARSFIGQGVVVFVNKLRSVRGIPDKDHDTLMAQYLTLYESAVTLTQLYPGVVETLTQLRAEGHALGLCTNKPMRPTMALLRHLNLERQFLTIIAGDSLPVHKPDPGPLHAAFAMEGISGPALYVGDSEVDAETARRAGVPLLLFTEGYRSTPVSDLSHHAAFSAYADLPGLVAGFAEG